MWAFTFAGLSKFKNTIHLNTLFQCENTSQSQGESIYVRNTIPIYPPTTETNQMLILRYLTSMGEYQEVSFWLLLFVGWTNRWFVIVLRSSVRTQRHAYNIPIHWKCRSKRDVHCIRGIEILGLSAVSQEVFAGIYFAWRSGAIDQSHTAEYCGNR